MEKIQCFFATLLSGLMAYFHPLQGEMEALLTLFIVNFFAGLFAGLLTNNESFSFRKAWKCVIECTTFVLLIACIYFIGEHKGEPDGALWCVSAVTYGVIYFYSCNILKNLRAMFRNGTSAYKAVSFIYYLLTVEFVKKIPYVNNYLNNENN